MFLVAQGGVVQSRWVIWSWWMLRLVDGLLFFCNPDVTEGFGVVVYDLNLKIAI